MKELLDSTALSLKFVDTHQNEHRQRSDGADWRFGCTGHGEESGIIGSSSSPARTRQKWFLRAGRASVKTPTTNVLVQNDYSSARKKMNDNKDVLTR
jgi:hypothetical protein